MFPILPSSLPARTSLLAPARVLFTSRAVMRVIAKQYLKNANAVGRVLRYVAEYQGQWVALLVFCSPALHLKLRDQWLHWQPRQVKERRHLIAQNARFLVLGAPGRWPNLALRILEGQTL